MGEEIKRLLVFGVLYSHKLTALGHHACELALLIGSCPSFGKDLSISAYLRPLGLRFLGSVAG